MPPHSRKSTGPTPVDAITYADKRANLPLAGAEEFVAPEVESPLTFSYPRPLYEPQLVWRGKEELDLAGYWKATHRRSTSRRRSIRGCW